MASTSETGHAKNVANFQDMRSFVAGYGAAYNPSKASIKAPALLAKDTACIAALAATNAALAPNITNVNAREIQFALIPTLVSRIVNAAQASDISPEAIADVKSIARKLTGRRAKAKIEPVQDDPATPEDESKKSSSSSQMSFDSRIENFDKLIQGLIANPGYAPNEADLKVTALQAFLVAMKATDTAVIASSTALSNARIDRNVELYKVPTGLVPIANDVKSYVKSLFGPKSPQFKQLSKLKFTSPKV